MARTGFNSALTTCAMTCALRRLDKKCKTSFNDPKCFNCRFYIAQYVNADPRHIELFMMEVENKAYMLHSDAQPPWLLIIAALILLFIMGLPFIDNYKARKQLLAQEQPTPTSVVRYDDITSTLQKVSYDLKVKQVDVNKDGLINCIDAAVLFYKYFPDKDRVCIERNYNPGKDFNHLFNCVKVNSVWRAIEPQSQYRGWSTYWMRDIWTKQYDSTLNQDETEMWKVFVK